jgi:hypothetical protein
MIPRVVAESPSFTAVCAFNSERMNLPASPLSARDD